MDSMEILYDHYKETNNLSREAQVRRNKSFLFLCILQAIMFLLLIRPEKAFDLIASGINAQVDFSLQIGNTIVQTLLWIIITYMLIRYIQDVLYVERQYEYLDKIEKEISEIGKMKIFEREGNNYQRQYPIVLNLIDLFYKMFMPVFFIVINTIRIIKEWKMSNSIMIALICDTIIYIAILMITWFYFFEIHSKITDFIKKRIPFIDLLAKKLRNILKEV